MRNVILSAAKNPGRMFLLAILLAATAAFAAKKVDAEEQARIQEAAKNIPIFLAAN